VTGGGLIVHYRSLLVLGFEWEDSLENAVLTLQAGSTPVSLDPRTGEDALVHFFLYPASGHSLIANGDQIGSALASIKICPTTRVILAACAPTTPALQEEAVNDLANSQLAQVPKKYAIRALETTSLETIAEKHMRHVLRQLGFSGTDSGNDQSVHTDQRSLLSYEDRPWSW